MAVSVSEFIDDNLRLYSAHSNVRGIPFIGDGLKQSQRKAVWGMLKRGESADKDTVERVSSRISSDTDYHHGVGSMELTVVGLAQDFAGSNNIPLFEKFGQFGDRLNKKPSAPRYIKTKLGSYFRKILKKEDDLILEHLVSNAMEVEPKFFIPLLPLVLINGAEGMGTGHSTYILCHNPSDIKSAILKLLDGKTIKKHSLVPWWKGFSGSVSRDSETGQVSIEGRYSIKEGRTTILTVSELPIGAQSDSYKAHLDKLEDKGVIIDYDNLSDKNGFEFSIKIPRNVALKSDEEIKKLFKLTSKETENLTVWDSDGVLKRFECVEDLLEEWVGWRVSQYEVRRKKLIDEVNAQIDWSSMKIRFIKFYLGNVDKFKNTGKADLINLLLKNDFSEYDRLLSMPIWSLTRDRIKELENDLDELRKNLKNLEADNAIDMYKRELKEFKYESQ